MDKVFVEALLKMWWIWGAIAMTMVLVFINERGGKK